MCYDLRRRYSERYPQYISVKSTSLCQNGLQAHVTETNSAPGLLCLSPPLLLPVTVRPHMSYWKLANVDLLEWKNKEELSHHYQDFNFNKG